MAVLTAGLVYAQVIGDPFGLVQIGTAGESTCGSAISVSSGGSANCGAVTGTTNTSAACSGGGPVEISTSCTTNGDVALSGTGSANAVSVGPAVSGTGNACGYVAVSITGTVCAYGPLGVSGTGDTCSNGMSITVRGQACTTGGSQYGALTIESGSAEADGLVVSVFTGSAPAPVSAVQATEAAYVPSPTVLAAKLQTAANINTTIVYDLATGVTGAVQPSACSPEMMTCVPRYMTLSQPQDYQKTGWNCGPETTRLVLDQMTGVLNTEDSIATAEGTTHDGTDLGAVVYYLDHNQSRDTFYKTVPSSPSDYMDMVATDAYYGYTNSGGGPGNGHSLINHVETSFLQYWDSGGRPIEAGHYQITYGYDTRSGGSVNIFDEYNPTAIPSNEGGYPGWTNQMIYGTHVVPLSQIYPAIRHSRSQSIAW